MDSQSRLVKRLGGGQKRTACARWSLGEVTVWAPAA